MVSKLPFPSIYLLTSHLTSDEVHRLEKQIPTLTREAAEATVILGKLSRAERAQFELRRLGITVVDETRLGAGGSKRKRPSSLRHRHSNTEAKRRTSEGGASAPIVISSSSESGDEEEDDAQSIVSDQREPQEETSSLRIQVVKLAWFDDSVAQGKVLPLSGYIVYEGRRALAVEPTVTTSTAVTQSQPNVGSVDQTHNSAAEKRQAPSQHHSLSSPLRPTYGKQQRRNSLSRRRTVGASANSPSLARKSTSENEADDTLPPIPTYLETSFSCQRPTPVHPVNEAFVEILKKIRHTRQLVGDQIGVRAYSTAIASLAAYPYKLSVPTEVARLPGCGKKFAQLFREFARTGRVREAEDSEADPKLTALRLFCNIWGVAETTARSFYNHGWRELDDVIEFGWKDLTRVQQIGVKFYEEFQELMTRPQVEAIANRVLAHANQIHPGFHMVIAGGYRRGKDMNGDVDVILSHPDASATHLIIADLVLLLEQSGLVTHTLTLSTANSERDQQPVNWKGNAPRGLLVKSADAGPTGATGFDTLDKALVVWQDPSEEKKSGEKPTEGEGSREKNSTEDARKAEAKTKNTNPHRRVDIVVSPWRTVGCAVLGWSGGTTFQRDLRRYCKTRGLKFDSSGARSRLDGSWVDLEDTDNPAPDMLTAEQRVFKALELEWRPPDERCTG